MRTSFPSPPPPLLQAAKENMVTATRAKTIIAATLRVAWSFATAKLPTIVFMFFMKTP
jgi:acyl-CoA hydrolase